MQSRRLNPSVPIALTCLVLIGCVDWGRELVETVLGSNTTTVERPEPVPPGARRAASREDIVNALMPREEATRRPRVIATLEEVADACPCLAQRMDAWREHQALPLPASGVKDADRSPLWTAAAAQSNAHALKLRSDEVHLAGVTLHVETGSGTVMVKLGEPVKANGGVYGYVEAGAGRE